MSSNINYRTFTKVTGVEPFRFPRPFQYGEGPILSPKAKNIKVFVQETDGRDGTRHFGNNALSQLRQGNFASQSDQQLIQVASAQLAAQQAFCVLIRQLPNPVKQVIAKKYSALKR